MPDIRAVVENVMKKNQRSVDSNFYTVPSIERYPFQWLWDSCFHSLIYLSLGHHTEAKEELRSICKKQHQNGLIPHISFWHEPNKPLPNWGRELRGEDINHIFGVTGSSFLTQPPLIVRAVLECYKETDDIDFLLEMYPKLANFLAYLKLNRTFKDSELLFIINPDESGEDNSPRFDTALNLTAVQTAEQSLVKRIELMEKMVVCDFDTKKCMQNYFSIVDVGFNCIYADALEGMIELAELLGEGDDVKKYGDILDLLRADIKQTLTTDDTYFYSLDCITREQIPVNTWNLFMPLYAELVDESAAKKLVAILFSEETFWSQFGVRTTSASEPSYDGRDGFWRGSIWAAPHWFIYKGLQRYGFNKEASILKAKTLKLIELSGMYEHYDPLTGVGFGAKDFTWPGLIVTME